MQFPRGRQDHRKAQRSSRAWGFGRRVSGLLLCEPLEERYLLSALPVSELPAGMASSYAEATLGGTATPLINGSSSPYGYTPTQMAHAYGFDKIFFANGTIKGDGAGQTIAIITAYDNPNIA